MNVSGINASVAVPRERGTTNKKTQAGGVLMIVTIGAAIVIFVTDLYLPMGIAISMLYVVPVLLSVQTHRREFALSIAAVCTVLTVVGSIYSPPGAPIWMVMTNRGMSVVAIWGIAFLALQHSQAKERINVLHSLLPICASCKKIRDDKGYWNQVEQYIESQTKSVLTHGICPDCLEKWYPDFYPQVAQQFPDLFKEQTERLPFGRIPRVEDQE